MSRTAVFLVGNTARLMVGHYHHLMRHLSACGLSIHLYTPDAVPDALIGLVPHDVFISRLPYNRSKPSLLAFLHTACQGWRIGLRFPQATFTLVTLQSYVLWGWPLRLLNRRTIFLMAGMGTVFSSAHLRHRFLRPVIARLYRFLYSGRNSRVVVQNRDDLTYVIEALCAHPQRTFLMNGCGADANQFPFFTELPQKKRKVILIPARIIVEKGIFEAVAASRILRERGIDHEMQFTAGIDPGNPLSVTSEDLERFQKENDSIRFLGFVPEMAPVFQACDIVCLPTYREGLPTALIESAACGRPIVTTNAIGCRDIVKHDETGLVVPVGSAEALADALALLIQDQGLAERLRQNAYRQFQQEFTKERTVEQALAAYRSLGIAC
jgi:glycosyltransferase involved in cell wall biosynthesis